MAINRETLRLIRMLRVTVGTEADDATRTLTTAWVRAWDGMARDFRAALHDLVVLQAELGRWPQPWELARVERLRRVLAHAEAELVKLADRTGVVVTDAAGRAITATIQAEPQILASQLPAPERAAAAVSFDRVPTAAVNAIVQRTTQQITALSWPLSHAAAETIRRELTRGVAAGTGPRETARLMLARTEGAFNGGLARALNVARTETLDAYRVASKTSHTANRDVVSGWTWHCSMDKRTCPSCWAMHGTQHPVDEIGPNDHQQGRCARVATLRPWRELGINIDEPPSRFPDARARFDALPEADQLAVMGPARLELLKSGKADWNNLAQLRTTPGWRDSYTPRTVADLRSGVATTT